jgi:hypothetical protein
VAERTDPTLPVEASLRIRTGLYFTTEGSDWQVLYERPGGPEDDGPVAVVMTRPVGAGTLVLCSDTYFLSNEALRSDRAPAAIAYLLGDGATVLFSETHLGNGQRDRIMTLVRRYRLHGVLAGFFLLGLLFLWRNATTLLPRRDQTARAETESEQSQHRGLEALLTRFVPQSAVLDHCVEAWQGQFGNTQRAAAVAKASEPLRNASAPPKDEATIVALYNQIASAAAQRDARQPVRTQSGLDP